MHRRWKKLSPAQQGSLMVVPAIFLAAALGWYSYVAAVHSQGDSAWLCVKLSFLSWLCAVLMWYFGKYEEGGEIPFKIIAVLACLLGFGALGAAVELFTVRSFLEAWAVQLVLLGAGPFVVMILRRLLPRLHAEVRQGYEQGTGLEGGPYIFLLVHPVQVRWFLLGAWSAAAVLLVTAAIFRSY